ncbi:hypothetical protein [Schumannella soli]|uniref:Uncharacterized protein n=1 Tax=Schumannella soli TaxID=2590779 RepID=A0A506Y6Y1_9MICO|nr:hypothetical protein [Schumannella soli]TPW77775.1 hypothetical protein FJ657_03765 [Schumannella soli]
MSNPQQPGEQPIQQGQPGQVGQPYGGPEQPGQPSGAPGQPGQQAAFVPGQYTPAPKRSRKGLIIGLSIVAAVIIIGGAVAGVFLSRAVTSVADAASSPSGLAKLGAEAANKQQKLPYDVDQYTTLESITSSGPKIQYTYTVHGIDPAALTKDALVSGVQPQLCSTSATKKLLDEGVVMAYRYTVEETGDRIDFQVTKSDC